MSHLAETPSAPTSNTEGEGAIAARLEDAVKVYGSGDAAVRALDGVTVEFERGRFTAVMGPSGSGKSTLLHCATGLDTLTSGRAWVGDVDISTLRDAALTRLRRERVGFVFQAFNLIPTMNARENILLPLMLDGRSVDDEWYNVVIDALGLRDRLTHRPSELSGGQQQRVAVARAMIARPDLILGDEPTGNLDSTSSRELLELLSRAVHEYAQTIVMVTHDPVAACHASRVIFLNDGRVVESIDEPTVDRVLSEMAKLRA